MSLLAVCLHSLYDFVLYPVHVAVVSCRVDISFAPSSSYVVIVYKKRHICCCIASLRKAITVLKQHRQSEQAKCCLSACVCFASEQATVNAMYHNFAMLCLKAKSVAKSWLIKESNWL